MAKSESTLIRVLQEKAYARIVPATDTCAFTDVVLQAKTFLCHKTKTLFNDPVWDQYADEEILIEYFAWLFAHNEEYRNEFAEVKDDEDSLYEWFDQQVTGSPESFQYTPE